MVLITDTNSCAFISPQDAGDCKSTIECIMKNIDPKEFCCKDDKSSPPATPQSGDLKIVPQPDPKSENVGPGGNPPGSGGSPPGSGGSPPGPSQPTTPSSATPPPPPPPPPQMCECTCPDDGAKLSITRGQFDSLKSSAAYRSALMHEAYNSYHWNPYSAYGQMPYARAPYAYGR